MNENNENVQSQSSEQPAEQPSTTPPTCSSATVEDKDVCNLAMLCHLLGIFTYFVGPLIIWLLKKDSHKFIDDHGKAAVNWQISVAIYCLISMVLVFVGIGLILMPVLVVLNLIFCIIAALKARDGQPYSYPLAIKFLK